MTQQGKPHWAVWVLFPHVTFQFWLTFTSSLRLNSMLHAAVSTASPTFPPQRICFTTASCLSKPCAIVPSASASNCKSSAIWFNPQILHKPIVGNIRTILMCGTSRNVGGIHCFQKLRYLRKCLTFAMVLTLTVPNLTVPNMIQMCKGAQI